MKPGCTIHPLRTGFRLFTPSILYKIPIIWIWKVKRLKHDIEELVNAGARHIELVDDVIHFGPDFPKKFCKEMEQIARYIKELEKNGIAFSIHVAHKGYHIPSRFEELMSGTITRFKNMTEYFRRLDPVHYTLHLGLDEIFYGREFKGAPSKRTFIKKKGVTTLAIKEILREAPAVFNGLKEIGIDLKKIYIENSEGMTRKEFDALFNPLSEMFPELGCILDTGHLLVEEYLKNEHCLEDAVEYWGKKKKKLKAVHIHDVIIKPPPVKKDLIVEAVEDLEQRKGETLNPTIKKLRRVIASIEALSGVLVDHQPIGTGILNLPSLLRALKEADFKGVIIYEPGAHNYKKATKSVKFLAEEIEKIKQSK